jgi:hypothetical protein
MKMQREDRILEGALDIHAHGYPEFTLGMPPRVTNLEWVSLAAQSRMRGFVMKSHVWPTTAAAHMLRDIQPDLEVFASITLNPPVGGLSPVSVEMAAQMGAKVAWMPTWSARQETPKHSIYLERMRPWIRSLDPKQVQGEQSLSILDEKGDLVPEVLQILEICSEHGVTVASGHLPSRASLVLCRQASEMGVRFVMTHPLSGSVGASIDEQLEIVAHGGMIEHVLIGCMPMHQRADPRNIVEAIEAVGPEHCIMASDAIEAWNPPAPEVLRMFIASMLALGVKEDAVHLMTHDNPASALGLSSARTDQ